MPERQHTVNRKRHRTPAGDAFSLVAFQILRLGGLLGAAGDELAAPSGQSSARWQVLAAVENTPMTVAAIARALGLARQSVQRVADLLADEGLAVYRDNPEHARAMLLELTARGRAALASIQRAQRDWADRLGAAIGEADLRRTAAVLERIAAQVSGDPSGRGAAR
jgi:DNA-binding MarR family transcriptional regulator